MFVFLCICVFVFVMCISLCMAACWSSVLLLAGKPLQSCREYQVLPADDFSDACCVRFRIQCVCVFGLRIYVSFLVFLIFQYYRLSVVSHTFLSIQFCFISWSIFYIKCFLTIHLPASLYRTHLFPVFGQFQVFLFQLYF